MQNINPKPIARNVNYCAADLFANVQLHTPLKFNKEHNHQNIRLTHIEVEHRWARELPYSTVKLKL